MRDGAAGHLEVAGAKLEYLWLGPPPEHGVSLVLLHEGLGSAGMWRDFPRRLVEATGCGALVYSRQGYGASDPAPLPRPVRFMHEEGLETLPKVLAAAGIGDHILVGHSDGASISIVNAGGIRDPRLKGLILEAPHVFNEEVCVAGIRAVAEAYRTTDLPQRLARFHGANTEGAFWGWNEVWLDPDFLAWNIEEYLPPITVPVLAIQGEDDEYGTMAQLDAVAAQVGGPIELLKLPRCGHSPHRDQEEAVLAAMTRFVKARLA